MVSSWPVKANFPRVFDTERIFCNCSIALSAHLGLNIPEFPAPGPLRVCEKIDRRRLMIARFPPIVVKADPELETPEWQPTLENGRITTVFKGSNRHQATSDHEINCQF